MEQATAVNSYEEETFKDPHTNENWNSGYVFPLKVNTFDCFKRKQMDVWSCLGCMAERLKTELLEREKLVDIIAGPDAYRDLPSLLTVAEGGQQASNVLLSLEETYADIMPVQHAPQTHSAYV